MFFRSLSSPIAHLLVLVIAVIVSVLFFSTLSIVVAPLFGFSAEDVRGGVTMQNPLLTLYLLAVNSFSLFLFPTLFAVWITTPRRPMLSLGLRCCPQTINVIRGVFLAIAAVPFISFAAGVNAQLPLPEWISTLEEHANAIMDKLLSTKSYLHLYLNIFVMAILPAFSEEFFFRGYLQPLIRRWTKQTHLSIFITAFVFSAFHMQFEGFIPRLLLGVILGYTFYWSKSLWLSIVIHFANNAFAVLVYFYAAQHDIVLSQLEDAFTENSLGALLSLLTSAVFLFQIFVSERLYSRKIRV
ncbi:MAG: lysostaphin resistance A-like protein [Bacteroidales bacterium]